MIITFYIIGVIIFYILYRMLIQVFFKHKRWTRYDTGMGLIVVLIPVFWLLILIANMIGLWFSFLDLIKGKEWIEFWDKESRI